MHPKLVFRGRNQSTRHGIKTSTFEFKPVKTSTYFWKFIPLTFERTVSSTFEVNKEAPFSFFSGQQIHTLPWGVAWEEMGTVLMDCNIGRACMGMTMEAWMDNKSLVTSVCCCQWGITSSLSTEFAENVTDPLSISRRSFRALSTCNAALKVASLKVLKLLEAS